MCVRERESWHASLALDPLSHSKWKHQSSLLLQVYQIQVTRDQSLTTLFRRYREFDELHKRLVLCFPSDSLPNFPGKTFLPGKSRTRETAEKRLVDLNSYLNDLLGMEARISEVVISTRPHPHVVISTV